MANQNKTIPTDQSVEDFLSTVSAQRAQDAREIIKVMHEISGEPAVMWGPSIVGFGSRHYIYDTGREGDMPRLGFSPRKANLTIYFNEGFDDASEELGRLGPHSLGVSCLYVKDLAVVDRSVLRKMLETSYRKSAKSPALDSVEAYVAQVPMQARVQFDALRQIVRETIPTAHEVVSYAIIGYKVDEKRAKVFVSGWKDHVALYPIPKDAALRSELAQYTKGKGTLWFPLDTPLPRQLIERTVVQLVA